MADWVRSLPVESLAPVGILFLAGLLLLCFGQRLLKPVLVLAAVFAGVIIAVRIGSATQSTLSPLIWSGIGAVAGVIVVTLSYRLALGLAVGVFGAAGAVLLALTAAEFGLVDVGAKPSQAMAAAGAPIRLVAQTHPPTGESESGAVPSGGATGLEASSLAWLDRGNAFFASAGEQLRGRWDALPAPMRTLLSAAGAAGGFIGFVAGLASPVWAAATVTSLLGSFLTLVCGVPLLQRFVPPDSLPTVRPMGWLVLWLLLAAIGWSFQWMTRPKPQPKQSEGRGEAS